MSRPTQVEFAGPGWRFLRHSRLVVWVYTKPALCELDVYKVSVLDVSMLTVRVNYRNDIEVKIVQHSPGVIVACFVAVDELQCEILNRLGRPCQPNDSLVRRDGCISP